MQKIQTVTDLGQPKAEGQGDLKYGAITLMILVGLIVALYADILIHMARDWYNDPDYSHGFLIPVLAAFFVWERREGLRAQPIVPDIRGIALLGFGCLMLIVGSVGAELYLQRTSLIVVLAGLVLLILGPKHSKLLTFPLVFLVFMVPLPAIVVNLVSFPLQLLAAKTAALCLFNLGIPVLREGNVIALAGTTLEVAEACSGIRSLQALMALGTVYAYFSQTELWKRWVLVLLSIPIAIVANAFRVTGTGVLAQYFGAEAAEGFYHTFSGLVIFGVAFALLLACGVGLSKIHTSSKTSARLSVKKSVGDS